MKTIFLVDDDADDRELFQSALKELNPEIRLLEAENGKDALTKMLSKDFPLPDLMFFDLNMPKINGLELLIETKKHSGFKSVPLYIYTTSRSEEEKNTCIKEGATGFISKHYSYRQLCKELKHLFEHHFAEQVVS